MRRLPLLKMFTLTTLAAALLAASETIHPDGWGVMGRYVYWAVRIFIEGGLFIAVLQLLTLAHALSLRPLWLVLCAVLLSYLPFALAVTALDIVLGLPELGDEILTKATSGSETSKMFAFILELGYLLDNHIALCFLISTPMLLDGVPGNRFAERPGKISGRHPADMSTEPKAGEQEQHSLPERQKTAPELTEMPIPFLLRLDPPFDNALIRAEAQEHYVRLVGDLETRMVLYRFNDILHELPDDLGMQIHRSHWVAYKSVKRLFREASNLKLETSDRAIVPVSRKYASDAEVAFGIPAPAIKESHPRS